MCGFETVVGSEKKKKHLQKDREFLLKNLPFSTTESGGFAVNRTATEYYNPLHSVGKESTEVQNLHLGGID